MGQVDEGLALAKAQLTGGADDREVEEDLAQIYIRLKRFKEASEQLDKADALATKPDEKLDVFYLRGEFYERQKMYDQAEAQFRKALAIDPHNPGVLNYLGYMLADQGEKLPEALKMIRQAVDLEPQNGAYLDSLGWVYFKSGQYTEAEENLRKANERMNTDPDRARPSGRGVREDRQPEDGGGAVGAFDDRVCPLAAGRCRSRGRAEGAAQAGERARETGQAEPGVRTRTPK